MPSARVTLRSAARVSRARTLPLIVAPVALGAAHAQWAGAAFSWGWLALGAAGAGSLLLAANALNEVVDERAGIDKLARIERGSIATAPGVISTKTMSERSVVLWVLTFAIVAAVLGVLAASRHAAALWLGAAGALLGWGYAAPPLRYSYRGLGEAGIMLAFGPLPALGGWVLQGNGLDPRPALSGLVPGLLTMAAFIAQDVLHWRADKAVGKRTMTVRIGPEAALIAVGALAVLAYSLLALLAAFGVLPVWSLLAVVTAVPVASAWARAIRAPMPQRTLALFGACMGASVLAAVGVAGALVLAR